MRHYEPFTARQKESVGIPALGRHRRLGEHVKWAASSAIVHRIKSQATFKELNLKCKQNLDKIPELELAFYIHIGHLRNEIMFLQKMLWCNANNRTDHKILENVNVPQGLALVRLITGKLWEGWDLIQKSYYKSKVSMDIGSDLPREAKGALAELKDYFKKDSTIRMIRNQFAFHYSPENIREQMALIDDTDQLEIYQTALSVNTFYQFSEIIANSAMLRAVDEDDYMDALNLLMGDVLSVAQHFLKFCDGCIFYMVLKYFSKKRRFVEWTDVQLPDIPRRNEITLPFFVKNIKKEKLTATS